MKFSRELYVGEKIHNKKRVVWKLKHHAGQVMIYVIALAGGEDQLEIYHCAYLQQKFYRENPPFIVGIASGYEEAVSLVQIMVQDIFEKTGDYRIKDYFLKKE